MYRWLRLVVALVGLGVLPALPGTAAADGDAEAVVPPPARRYLPVASAQYWMFPFATRFGDRSTVEAAGNLRLSGAFGAPVEALDTVFVGLLQYDWTNLLHDDAGTQERLEFHGLYLRAVASVGLAEQWRLNVVGSVGLASDFVAFYSEDLRLTVSASAAYRHSPELQVRFGVMYSSAFYRPLVLPLLAVNYHPRPWRLQFMIPRGGALWYELSEDLQVGLHLRIVNLRYQSHRESVRFDELTLLNFPLGASVLQFLGDGLYLLLEGGYNFQYARMVTGEGTRSRYIVGGWQVSLGVGFML